MNGTVILFNGRTLMGAIEGSDGTRFPFDMSAVLAYDAAALAVGKAVHFDVAHIPSLKAVNISIDPACDVPAVKDRRREIDRLRYIGFEHRGTVRSFWFERITPGMPPQSFSVDADLVLFRTYQVHLQEGPGLCLRLLSGGLEAAQDPRSFVPGSLSGQHMVSFLASRPVRRFGPGPVRKPAGNYSKPAPVDISSRKEPN